MKIIGHRGAAGVAPENTLKSIKSAIEIGVDAVEFDVRLTKDRQLVLCHDPTLQRIANRPESVRDLTLAELQNLPTVSGESIPSLQDALNLASATPVVIDAKGSGWSPELSRVVKRHPHPNLISVVSFNHRELFALGEQVPGIKRYALERTNAFETIPVARKLGFSGVDLNFWLLNPFTYWLAQRSKLEVIVYTVNQPWIAYYFKLFFPKVAITTNVPHKMQGVRSHLKPS